jgi:hypothetical protein
MMTERELCDLARTILAHGAGMVQSKFTRPDDDWEPIFLALDIEGRAFMAGGMTWQSMEQRHKTVAEVGGHLVRKHDAAVVALLASVWAAPDWVVNERGERVPDPAQRTEMVHILIAGATEALMAYAPIVRYADQPPELADWQLFGGDEAEETSGGLLDVLADMVRD